MLGRIKKGESVIGLRAISAGGWIFRRGPAIVRGSYIGKIYLCSDIKKEDWLPKLPESLHRIIVFCF